MTTNIKDVAKLARVSISTVSRVFTNSANVSAETKQRVLEAVEALNYHPNFMAKSLKEGHTNTLGLIVPDISNPYYPKIVKGIEKHASAAGYSIILCDTNEDPEKERRHVQVLKQRYADGIMMISDNEPLIREVKGDGIPLVVVNRMYEGVDCVSSDNHVGAGSMVQYLIDQGHRKIACIFRSRQKPIYRERFEGCVETLQKNSLPAWDRYMLHDVDGVEDCYCRVMQLLQSGDPPTAIFSSNDMLVMGIYKAVFDCGLQIPEDISVAGYDNISNSKYMAPPLTTFEQPVDEVGRSVVDAMIQQLKAPEERQPVQLFLNGVLVERASVRRLE